MGQTTFTKLSEVRNNLIKEIASMSYDEFNQRPVENKWSIAQVCHHLVLVELATTKAIQYGLKEGRDAENRKNVQILLDRLKKIKAPQIVEPDERPFEVLEMIDLLKDSREKLLRVIDLIENKSLLPTKSVKHPVLGELPLDQWIDMVYLHEQRHIEQIKEIKYIV